MLAKSNLSSQKRMRARACGVCRSFSKGPKRRVAQVQEYLKSESEPTNLLYELGYLMPGKSEGRWAMML